MVVHRSLLLVAAVFAREHSVTVDDECALMHQTKLVRTSNAGVGGIMSFPEFIAHFGRTYAPGSEEYSMRAALFEARAAAVQKHNRDPRRQWTAGINKLADRTAAELKALRGYSRHRRAGGSGGAASSPGSSSLALTEFEMPYHRFPKHRMQVANWNWGESLSALSRVRDQGGCGSCWAFAATTVLRAQSEIHSTLRDFSPQEVVSCVKNPDRCGGDGGCEGATAELAIDYLLRYSRYTEESFPYTQNDLQCPTAIQEDMQSAATARKGEEFGLVGWKRLPQNKLQPVKHALMSHGPIAVSIMVDDLFQIYIAGILPACRPAALINHAVALVGFGEETEASSGVLKRYWRIQNSWGDDWGEAGYVRLFRHEDSAEESHCGWDSQPEIGSGCAGGPEKVWVCGSCGILNDAVTPIFRDRPSHKTHHEPGVYGKDVVLVQTNTSATRH